MSEPIALDDTAALHRVFAGTVDFADMDDLIGIQAVAHAVCPETHVVVSRDDLRAVFLLAMQTRQQDWTEDDYAVIYRLRATLT